ncbi:sensor histidine kinase [Actinoplanes sp. NPDC023714]|uniref:sensor histidine kinase n=1 Tax=Actinoplanes sp. NPDC023714 TaxID=3154322 RepID=UPI0033F26DE0
MDLAIALLMTYLAGSAVLDPPGPAFEGPVAIAWLAGVLVAMPLTFRRRRPLVVFVFVLVAATLATGLGVVGVGVIVVTWLPVGLALYTVACSVGRFVAFGLLAGGLLAAAITIPLLYFRISQGILDTAADRSEVPLWWQVELGVVVVLLVTAWALGRLMRWRREVQAEAAQRLAHDMVAEERLRIARELHDIVGHSLSLIAVKATVANHIAEERPAEGRAALQAIEKTSRSALTEIRRLLDVLRTEDDPASLDPAPHISDLSDLVGRYDVEIDLAVDGVDDLPPALGLTVYRIVQESLTNVIKHAGASHCAISVRGGDGAVRIEVTDDGGRPPSSKGRRGQGLIGMRERVSLYGGTLTAGANPEGRGFRVLAVIPFSPEDGS